MTRGFLVLFWRVALAMCVVLGGCTSDDDDADNADDLPDDGSDDDTGDDVDDDMDDDGAFRCATPQGAPYPDTSSYGGIHAGPRNDDFVDCETASSYTELWHALQGRVIAQPNTFSPDGSTIYVTTSEPEPGACTVFALDAADGGELWCRNLPGAITSSVEVDDAGDLYVASDRRIVSWSADGAERWAYEIPQDGATDDNPNGAVGLHFTPDGRVATVTDLGVVTLLDRANGAVVASLDLAATLGFVPAFTLGGDIDLSGIVPAEVIADFEAVNGTDFDILSFIGSGGQFCDNTIGIGPDGALYITSGGPDPWTGSLIRVDVDTDGAPALAVRWYTLLHRSTAASPSISADGRWVRVSDGASPFAALGLGAIDAHVVVVDAHACNANTDADPAPQVCEPDFRVPLNAPALGAAPVFDEARHYFWEVRFSNLFDNTTDDVFAYDGETLAWSAALPDDAIWSSVLTLTRNHVIGTMTRLVRGDARILTIPLPDRADSEIVVLDRADGALVFNAPVADDATSTVTVGPDGSLYANLYGLVSAFAVDTYVVGGVVRFAPSPPPE